MLHRFCAFFPTLVFCALLALALSGCAGPGKNPWQRSAPAAAESVSGPAYGGTSNTLPPAAPSAQSTVAAASSQVKVALLLPLSGANAGIGQSMLQAAQLAIFDLGYDNLELMPRDTQGSAGGASAAAAAAINDGAQLILGPLFAEEVRAVKSATAGRNINVIAFSTDWTLAGGNVFIMGFLPFEQVERVAAFAAAKGLKKTAVVAGTDQYGSTVSRAFETEAQENGITISRALSDPGSYDSVFVPAGGSSLNGLLARVPSKTARKLGTGLWDDARLAANPSLEGAWFAAPSPAARKNFEDRYRATYGGSPVRIATLAYDATALAAALAKAGLAAGRGPAFDSASLKNRNGFAGVDGIIRFTPQNLAERGMAILEIRNGQIAEIDPAPASFAY